MYFKKKKERRSLQIKGDLELTSYDKMFIKFYMKKLRKTQANVEEKSRTLTLPNIIIIKL